MMQLTASFNSHDPVPLPLIQMIVPDALFIHRQPNPFNLGFHASSKKHSGYSGNLSELMFHLEKHAVCVP